MTAIKNVTEQPTAGFSIRPAIGIASAVAGAGLQLISAPAATVFNSSVGLVTSSYDFYNAVQARDLTKGVTSATQCASNALQLAALAAGPEVAIASTALRILGGAIETGASAYNKDAFGTLKSLGTTLFDGIQLGQAATKV